ncbi:MAG TPA: beta-ketoacyl synthase N-terminal-like domain-containing protein [Ideonella sp.]|uniref:beta-ketoacyl synthase N-terminal-like domain-containing protein n=1 Tax=Ideonella sp. TaxID=1929293 RepID=UPI002CC0C486|nr:beta-ketoacyl synthase N-terminal-like domain-containing protein [Ideonella sp.]HSI49049.1 beta-ketoacyl synthase N-terminal-like domain-containing protein [Ideonella sp.]
MDIALFGMGACTAVGHDLASTAAAVRAGISGFAEHRFAMDSLGEPIRVAAAPWLESTLKTEQRLEILLFTAIDEALGEMRRKGVRLALSVGLPEPRPGLPSLAAWSQQIVGARFKDVFTGAAFAERGHAAALIALQAAQASILAGDCDACVVAGVDSWVNPVTLAWLESTHQLHGVGRYNNAWGFVPGEAGAALLIARVDLAETLHTKPLARLLRTSSGEEKNCIKTPTVCTGVGLTAVMREVLAARPGGARVSDLYSDMNGEPYRADEFGFAIARTSQSFVHASAVVTPADCTGDVGAASGALHLALAATAVRKRYASGSLALTYAGSEGGARAAALIGFD